MRALLCTLFLTLGLTTLCAQKNWTMGTITTTSGALLSGELADQIWNDNNQTISFRENTNARSREILLAEIAAFSIGPKQFLVQEVTINTSPRTRGNLVNVENKTEKTMRVALQRIATGTVELYELITRSADNHFFIATDEQTPRYLNFGRYKKNTNGAEIIYELNEYRLVLNQAFTKCPKIFPKTAKVGYNRKSLKQLFEQYYACIGEEPDDQNSSAELGFKPGLVAAVGSPNSNFEIFKNFAGGRDDQIFAPGVHLSAGVFGYLYFGGEQKTLIRGELRYHQVNYTASNTREGTSSALTVMDVETFEESSITFKLGGELIILNSQKPLSLTLGVSADFSLGTDHQRTEVLTSNGISQTTVLTARAPIYEGQTLIGPSAGILWRLGKVSLAGTYTQYSVKDEFRNDRSAGGRLLFKTYLTF